MGKYLERMYMWLVPMWAGVTGFLLAGYIPLKLFFSRLVAVFGNTVDSQRSRLQENATAVSQ